MAMIGISYPDLSNPQGQLDIWKWCNLALVCAAYSFPHYNISYIQQIVSFFYLLFFIYVGDNVEFKYGVGY